MSIRATLNRFKAIFRIFDGRLTPAGTGVTPGK